MRIIRTLAATVLAAGSVFGISTAAATASPAPGGERPPACVKVTVDQNSGNGPAYRVQLCGGMFRGERGATVKCVVDGGKWGPGAVSFCKLSS